MAPSCPSDLPRYHEISRADQRTVRHTAVILYRNGFSIAVLCACLGICTRTLRYWIAAFALRGMLGLDYRPKSGRPRKLQPHHMDWILKLVIDKNPRQLKFEFAYWTVARVRMAFCEEFGLSVSTSTIRRAMRRLKLTPQKPCVQAFERDQKQVDTYLDKTYPALLKRAQQENAVIAFVDEAGARSDCHLGRTWALRGQTPLIEFTGTKFRWNLVALILPDGRIVYQVYEESTTGPRFCEFLDHVVAELGERKIIIVADNVSFHKGKAVAAYLEAYGSECPVELKYLPTYSPELNPVELVWSWVKRRVGQQVVKTKADMKAKLTAALEHLVQTPDLVKSFFQHESCVYALG